MDNVTLFRQLKDYDSEEDIRDEGGNYGIYLANLSFYKSKKFGDFREWLMMARLSTLEEEALLIQNN